jgi:AraC family transcriptional regulator of adaptative response/methylated-DNA-[protein]-cysteine methyltransferase
MKDEEILFAIGDSSLGALLVAQSVKGICAVMFGRTPSELKRDLQDRFPLAILVKGDSKTEKLLVNVLKLIEDPMHSLDMSLDERGTQFQQRVWNALREIPAGVTASYSEIARKIGQPKSARAVARACATNPLAIIIPCHRVVRSDGSISGYRWGVECKKNLLQREKSLYHQQEFSKL